MLNYSVICVYHLNVFVIQNEPFVMLNPDYPMKSQEKFIGICPDLVKELQKRIGMQTSVSLLSL